MKMKMLFPWFCVFGIIGWSMSGCEPIQSYSVIPEIHFKKLVFVDSIHPTSNIHIEYAVLSFSFIDGNGDLGVRPNDIDSISKIHYTWFKKVSDEKYDEFQFASGAIKQTSDIPYDKVMEKSEAQNKTLKGTMRIAMETPLKPQGVDIMRIEFYIVDRAGNESNIAYTPDFSILDPPYEPILPE